jgi:DNA-binding MarR family transcriptional regulator
MAVMAVGSATKLTTIRRLLTLNMMQQLRNATIRRVSPEACARDVLAGVPAVMRVIRSEMRSRRQAELSVPQFRTLIFLSHADDASLSALAEHLGLSLSATSRSVDALVRRGLLDRQVQTGDRRRVRLSLTARGRAAFETALSATQRAIARRFKVLSREELSQIRATMHVLERVFSTSNGNTGSSR